MADKPTNDIVYGPDGSVTIGAPVAKAEQKPAPKN
jgi:hypothetical protein